MKKTSEVDILNDGFRWQKYGQKDIISKDTLTLGDICVSFIFNFIYRTIHECYGQTFVKKKYVQLFILISRIILFYGK
jgi:hypothetical protein